MSVLSDKVYLLEQKQRLKDLEQEKRKKEIEKIQRKKELQAEQKQYEKDLLLACKNDLKCKFEEEFSLQGLDAKYTFYNIEIRDNLIKQIAKNSLEYDFLENNYNKILKQAIQKYELHKKYQEKKAEELTQEYIESMLPIWDEEEKQEKRKQAIYAFFKTLGIGFKWIFIIVFGLIFILLKIISELADRQ